jgi:hypothetical protein
MPSARAYFPKKLSKLRLLSIITMKWRMGVRDWYDVFAHTGVGISVPASAATSAQTQPNRRRSSN